jgi:xylose isomerase
MRNYLFLKEKAQAFRADPVVTAALEAARVGELAVPTLGAGESLADLRAETFDPHALGERGLQFERLDQLAMEHLLGVR